MTPSAITPKMIRREISFSMIDPELERVIETVQYVCKDINSVDIWLIHGVPYRLVQGVPHRLINGVPYRSHGTSGFISNGVSEILNAIKRIMED